LSTELSAKLDWEAAKWKAVAKEGVIALCPPCQQMRNIPARRCPNPLRYLVFYSETADEFVSHAKNHLPFIKSAAQNSTISTNINRNFCKVLDGNVSFPSLRTVIHLPVVMP
jgi:hypothetical protein